MDEDIGRNRVRFREKLIWFCRERLHHYVLAVVLLIFIGKMPVLVDPSVSVSETSGWGLTSPYSLPTLLALALLVTLLVITLSFDIFVKQTRLILSLIIVLLVGISVAAALWGYNVSMHFLARENSSNYMSLMGNMVKVFAAILTVAALGATMFGWWIQKNLEKLNQLDKRIEDVSKLAIVAAESALTNLPPASESQQVPEKVMLTLKVMDRVIFSDPERALLNYLDKTDNGARLLLAKAVYEYGRGNLPTVERELKTVIERAVDSDVRQNAMWLLTNVLRQTGRYPDSKAKAAELIREGTARNDNDHQVQGKICTALTYLAEAQDLNA
jgi:hypothetical protein